MAPQSPTNGPWAITTRDINDAGEDRRTRLMVSGALRSDVGLTAPTVTLTLSNRWTALGRVVLTPSDVEVLAHALVAWVAEVSGQSPEDADMTADEVLTTCAALTTPAIAKALKDAADTHV